MSPGTFAFLLVVTVATAAAAAASVFVYFAMIHGQVRAVEGEAGMDPDELR